MNTIATRPQRPLVPEDRVRSPRPSDRLVRACVAMIRSRVTPGSAEQVLTKMYPSDSETGIFLRAATSPATLTSSQWAGALAQTTVPDFIANLGPASAASALFRAGMSIKFEAGVAPIPSITGNAAGASFVEEGQPIPVRQLTVGGVTLTPKKLGTISTFTGEMARHSAIERILREVLQQNVGLALDAAVFGTAAATASAPAGLRNGVAGLTPTASGDEAAMRKDVGALAGAVAGVASGQIVFIGAPDVVAKLLLSAHPSWPYPILPTNGLPTNTLMAVAANAVAAAVDPVAEIDASIEVILHHEDTTPLQISTSPTSVAAPARSLFQTDSHGLRVILGVSWGLRAPSSVAWLTNITW